MDKQLSESEVLQLLMQAEEYEDALDVLHPEDAVKEDPTVFETFDTASSKLAIVVGHTQRSQGASGATPISTTEYIWNKQLAKHIKSIASSHNIGCKIFYRDGVGIVGAYKRVKIWEPDSCIELHFNAFNGQVIGTETLYGAYHPSKDWAEAIQQAIIKLYDRNPKSDRGIKQRKIGERGGKNVNQLDTIPSCLVEPYFGDVSSEAVLADDYLIDLAKAIVDTHINYFG